MLFSNGANGCSSNVYWGDWMLLELDSDQRLWRDTARDVLTKECPSSFVRSIAEDQTGSVDTAPLWRNFIAQGWTELTDPAEAVELRCWPP